MVWQKNLLNVNRLQTRHFIRRVRIHIWRRPKMTLFTALVIIILMYMFYQIFFWSPLDTHDAYDIQLEKLTTANKCSQLSKEGKFAFENFVRHIITTLDLLDVTHFLCYETLWTALKRSNMQASSSKNVLRISDVCFNLCILNEDLIKHDESLIARRFRNNGIAVNYIHSDGVYILKPTSKIYGQTNDPDEAMHPDMFAIHARIHVFEKDSVKEMYRRIGWKSRILPSTMCNQLHCFPPSLVDGKPLPKLEILPSLEVNVPREGIEIQKYHYPDSWWTMANSDDDCT